MENKIHPFKMFFLTALATWISREKSDVIEYLSEANKILKSKLEADGKRIKYTNEERARLAKKGRRLKWSTLCKFSFFITPETIIRWQWQCHLH